MASNIKRSGITVKDATQISIVLHNIPGATAQIAEAFQKEDINIEGICHTKSTGKTVTENIIVDRLDPAKKALKRLAKAFVVNSVLSIQLRKDCPGFIAAVARTLGNAGINIENIYHASSGRGGFAVLYISVAKDNFEEAKRLVRAL